MKVVSVVFFFLASFSLYGQGKKDRVTYAFEEEKLATILDSLSDLTGYQFSYNARILPTGSRFSYSATGMPIDEFLSAVFTGTGLRYSFFKDQIILNHQAPEHAPAKRDYFTLSGKIVDEKSNPIANVNVFLDGTTLGTSSDSEGRYYLASIPPGRYQLVLSYIGYKNGSYSIEEREGESRVQNHMLEINQQQLEEIEVVGKKPKTDKRWAASYQVFRKELLGPTEKGSQCTIENPEVLSFRFDSENNRIEAFASAPVEIRNDALGYRITYFLESFDKSLGDLRYRGKIRFKDMVPSSRSEARIWRKNRRESFNGSLNHFKQVLLRDEVRKSGFRMYQLANLKDYAKEKGKPVRRDNILVFKGDHYDLSFKDFLLVEFRKEKESERFLVESEFAQIIYSDLIDSGNLMKSPGDQISALQLIDGSVRLDISGENMDKFGMRSYGYWSWERIGDLVPINYNPKMDNFSE